MYNTHRYIRVGSYTYKCIIIYVYDMDIYIICIDTIIYNFSILL